MSEIITKSSDTPLEVLKFDSDEGKIVAYATTWNNADKVGDIIAPGALDKFAKRFNEESKQLPMLWNHDKNELIGTWNKLELNSRGAKIYGEIFTDVTRGNDVRNLIKRGAVGSVSIGFRSKNYEQIENGGRLFKELELVETSVVVSPANPKARIVSAKDEDGGINIRNLEKVLREAGLSRKESKIVLSSAASELRDAIKKESKKEELLRKLKET